jgi:hypothetical protein
VTLIGDGFEVALGTIVVADGIELVFVTSIVVYNSLALQSVGDIVLVTLIVVDDIEVAYVASTVVWRGLIHLLQSVDNVEVVFVTSIVVSNSSMHPL